MARQIQWTAVSFALTLGLVMLAVGPAGATLVGHYKLDETAGTTVFNSVSPPHGTSVNGPLINQPGRVNTAYDFDGSNDYATIADPGIGALDSFSIAAWIRADSLAGAQPTYGMGILRSTPAAVAAIGDFFLSVDDGGAVQFANWRVATLDATGRHYTADGVITAGSWYHVAATWDGALNRIYVNGVQKSFSNITTDSGWGAEVSIARQFGGAAYAFNGRIDDVGIWTGEALDAEQIQAIYGNGLIGFDLTNTVLIPEPSTFMLLGLGIVPVLRRRRRAART